ncbi:MAG: AMP-binding protein [Novosphingobium sp.]|nr:AMP-binding protein [Novosphingobium sp.]
MISIAHLVQQKAASRPDLDVLTFEHEGRQESRTYAQLWRYGQALAAALAAMGVGKGDRIGLLLQNHAEFVDTMVAAGILGAVLVPLDPRMRGEKLAFMLRDAGCVGIVCGDYALANVRQVLPDLPALAWIVTVGATDAATGASVPITAFADLVGGAAAPDLAIAVAAAGEPMQIMYTSGTTGDPKGIVVTHGRFIAATGYGAAMFGYREGDRPYTGLSLTHGNAQYVTLAPALAMGLRAVFSRKFTKSRLWDVIRANGCTTFSLLGGMATAIYSEPVKADDGVNPVRHVISAGMPAAIWNDFCDRFQVGIIEFYGAMEGGLLINPLGAGPAGSCGKPPATMRVRVIDEQGRDVGPGEPGELLFGAADGTPMQVEYVGKPEESARKTVDGWLRSGDIVVRDSEGWVFFRNRVGGGIRHNGDFIDPALVEKVVAEHPGVGDAFVWGVPSASGAPGEKDVVAAVVPVDPGGFDPQDLFAWCRSRLEPNMVPGYVQILAEIPKTASEKPQERFLREMFDAHPGAVVTEMRRQTA